MTIGGTCRVTAICASTAAFRRAGGGSAAAEASRAAVSRSSATSWRQVGQRSRWRSKAACSAGSRAWAA
ncbi:hypothetical protein ACFQ9X_27805 [Catenulispora yoronensis]